MPANNHASGVTGDKLGPNKRSMKKLLLCGALAIAIVGCATQTAFQSISAAETIALNSNAAYLDSVVTGITPTNQVPTVEAAFNDIQLSLHSAAAVASGGSSAPVPAALVVKVQNFTNLVNSVTVKK